MDWLNNLFFGTGVAHSVLVLSIVIALGVMLGKIKIAGISLGITWVLFVGIVFGHFQMGIEEHILHFIKEFGLILFIYSIGLQVGPGFFSSFKKTGIKLNTIAIGIVFSGVAVAVALSFIFNIPMPTMVGIMSGAVTNTPGLGAAQEAFSDINVGTSDPTISLGYAVAYPLGVIGVISAMLIIKYLFKISFDKEMENIKSQQGISEGANRISIEIANPALFGKTVGFIMKFFSETHFVISRRCDAENNIEIASAETVLNKGDRVLVVCDAQDIEVLTVFLGERIDMEWQKLETGLEARRIMVSNPEANGNTIAKLGLYGGFSFSITRVNRAGVDLVAFPNLQLQMGDRLTVVGAKESIEKVEKLVGNSMMKLRHPNLVPIFLGIFLGVLLGSIPFFIPSIPQPIKLGLAGGPLIVSILMSRFGSKLKIITYTTVSASLMIREIGIALFLACVGIGAGGEFISTIIDKGGYVWIGYGFLITMIPMMLMGTIARVIFKLDYFTLIGVLAGSCTNPPALAYSTSTTGNDIPAIGYATVYPLAMFMRVIAAQLLIIFFVA